VAAGLAGESGTGAGGTRSGSRFEEVLTPTTRVAVPYSGHTSPPALAALPSVDDSMYGNGALSSGVAREPTVTRLRI
jgi:hypothetical protein